MERIAEEWSNDVKSRYNKGNSILFDKGSTLFEDLVEHLDGSDRITIVTWALMLAEQSVTVMEGRYPDDHRPRCALTDSMNWAHGIGTMVSAKRSILNCHAIAKGLSSPEDRALCHAIGQACSVVHSIGHALGYPMYELTSLVHRYGPNAFEKPVRARVDAYISLLEKIGKMPEEQGSDWAAFLSR